MLAAVAGCSSDDSDAPEAKPAGQDTTAQASSNPLTGKALYVDPQAPAALQAARWRAQGRRSDAAAMAQLATRPTAVWIADEADVAARVREATQKADARRPDSAPGRLPRPRTRLRQLLGGRLGLVGRVPRLDPRVRPRPRRPPGSGDPRARRDPAGVQDQCLSPAAKANRYPLLRYAVRTLRDRTEASVYLDAGNPGWIQPAARLLARCGARASAPPTASRST